MSRAWIILILLLNLKDLEATVRCRRVLSLLRMDPDPRLAVTAITPVTYNPMPWSREFEKTGFADLGIYLGSPRASVLAARALSLGHPDLEKRIFAELANTYDGEPILAYAGHLLPKFANLNLGFKPRKSGLNCFHSALKFHDISVDDRKIEREEFWNALETHMVPLKAGLHLKFGDIFLFLNAQLPRNPVALDHAAIYLGSNLVFHKRDNSDYSLYVIDPLESVVGSYGHPNNLEVYRLKKMAEDRP